MSGIKLEKNALIDFLINDKKIDPKDLDLNDDKKVEFAEAAAYALKGDNWKNFLLGLDLVGLKHPLDTRNYDPKIKVRIARLAERAVFETTIEQRLDESDPQFCDALLTNFFSEGGATYENGGLCLAYPDWYQSLGEPNAEFTSKESFDICLKNSTAEKKEWLGSCTEHAYMPMGAVDEAAKTQPKFANCGLDFMRTENHAYVQRGGKSYDASQIGKIGWSYLGDAGAEYYSSMFRVDSNKSILYPDIAHLIDPFNIDVGQLDKFFKAKDIDGMLNVLDESIKLAPKKIGYFNDTIAILLTAFSKKDAVEFAFKVAHKWEDNPYSFLALQYVCLTQEDLAVLLPRISKEFPNSGYAEYLIALELDKAGDVQNSLLYLDKSLALNPNNPYALNSKAAQLVRFGKMEEAKVLLVKAMQTAPNLAGNHSLLAQIKMIDGDFKAALDDARKESLVYYGNPNAQFLTMNIYLQMAQPVPAYNMAQNYLDKLFPLLQKDPSALEKYKPTLNFLYRVVQDSAALMGDYGLETQAFSASASIDPGSQSYLESASILALYSHRPNIALEMAQKMDGGLIYAKVIKFNAFIQSGNLAEARKVLGEVREAMLGSPAVLNLEAGMELVNGNLERAREVAANLASLNEYQWMPELQMAQVDDMLGDTAAAGSEVAGLIKRFPDVAQIQSLNAWLLYEQGLGELGTQLAASLLTYNGNDIAAASVVARGALDGYFGDAEGRLGAVVDYGERIMEAQPMSVEGPYLLARAYMKAGEYEDALFYANIAYEKYEFSNFKFSQYGDLPMMLDELRAKVCQ